MKYTPAELTRLIGYAAAIGLGIFMTIWGVIHKEPATVTAGIGLIGTGGLAGANVPATRSGGRYSAD